MQNEKVANLKSKFMGLTIEKKILAIILFIVMLVFLFLLCGQLVGQMLMVFNTEKNVKPIVLGLTKGRPVTLVIWLIIIGFATATFFSTNMRNSVEYSENGIHYGKDKVGGTARWMNEAEIEQTFKVGDIKSSYSTIYGKLDKNSNKRIATYKRPDGPEGNRNTLVVASMGSGKTYTYVINELIQTILRGDSFVCTDPKGELFTTLARWCTEKGVDVHLLNLDPEHISTSEFWNCLQETIDPKTERLDSSRLNDFVNIYMQNSGEGKPDFWYNSALNLVKAVIGYISYKHEMEIISGYAELYTSITGEPESCPFVKKIKGSMCSFPEIRLTIESEAIKRGYSVDELQPIFRKIEKLRPKYKYNIGEVVDALLNFDEIEPELSEVAEWHPASFSYKMYKTNDTETVRKSALQGAQLRFALFSDNNIKDVLSYDGINIPDINMKQSAYFIIISDKVDTLKPISSLFFSFFFKDILDNYDKQKQLADERGVPNPCLGVTAMLEEFFSIGVISGSPRAFGKIMATCRSRKLYVSIIIQYITQIEELYGPFIKDAIQGGCATLYYLGGNDPATLKFISNFTGQTTVITESHQEGSSALSKTGTTVNVSAKARPLVTEEDARLWRNRVLLIKQGCQPVKFYPYGWDNHWVCYKGKDVHPKGYIHMKSEEITQSNGKKQTLWSIAPDSFTSYNGYIDPIENRVAHLRDIALQHPDVETEIHNDIARLSKKEMTNIVEEKPESFDQTEVIDTPENTTSNLNSKPDSTDLDVTEVLYLDQLEVGDTFTKDDLNKVGEAPEMPNDGEDTDDDLGIGNFEAEPNVDDSTDISEQDADVPEPDLDDLLDETISDAEENQNTEPMKPTQIGMNLDESIDAPMVEKNPTTNVNKLGRGKKKK